VENFWPIRAEGEVAWIQDDFFASAKISTSCEKERLVATNQITVFQKHNFEFPHPD